MKPILSVYVPYYVPIAYKEKNDKIYVVTISLLRGTSIGIYKDFKGLNINCQLSNLMQKALDELYDMLGKSFGIVIAVDAPPFWEIGVQSSIILGMNLALNVLSNNTLNIDTLHNNTIKLMTKLINVPWIHNLNLSKGISKFVINNNGKLEYQNTTSIKDNMRIIVGVKAQKDFPLWIKETNIYDPDEEYSKILKWTFDANLKYSWKNMDIQIVGLQKLKNAVEEFINYYASEEIVISQPDNMGVRIYRF